MWRGFGAEQESEPAQRGYFRPRISSISGVLAMTKQRLFTSTVPSMKDDIEAHTSTHTSPYNLAINPSVIDLGNGIVMTGSRYPSPGRSSFGDVMAYSRSASARPSIDSQTAHGVYGLDSGIHIFYKRLVFIDRVVYWTKLWHLFNNWMHRTISGLKISEMRSALLSFNS